MTEASGTASAQASAPGRATTGANRIATRTELVLLVALLAAAAATRFDALTLRSLWNDELFSVHVVNEGLFSSGFWDELRSDVHPPAYYVLLWLWTQLVGLSELSVRAASALLGVLGCLALWAFARRHVGPSIAAACLALGVSSPMLIHYAHEVRMYALLVLSTLWLMHAWLLLLEPRAHKRVAWGRALHAGAATAGTAYVHYGGLIFAAVLACVIGIYLLFRQRTRLRDVAVAGAAALLFYTPWALPLTEHVTRGGLAYLKAPNLAAVTEVGLEILAPTAWLGVLSLTVALLWWDLRRPERDDEERAADARRNVALMFASALLTLALVYVKSIVSSPIFLPRTLIVIVPPILVTVAWAAMRAAPMHSLSWWLRLLAICAVGAYAVRVETAPFGHRGNQQFREAAQCGIELAAANPDAKVLAVTFDDYFDEYFRLLGSDLRVDWSKSKPAMVPDAMNAVFAGGHRRVILLHGHIPLKKKDLNALRKHSRVLEHRSLNRAGCLLLEPTPSKPSGA